MPTNNNTQPTLLQCAICPARSACPWSQFSNAIRQKYCPVLQPGALEVSYNENTTKLRIQLDSFLERHLN